MTIDKNKVPTRLLWVDLEMTGLNPDDDVILEVAAEVTDFNFKTLASYEARVKHDRDKVARLLQQNIWYRDFPENRDDFLNNLDKGKPTGEVEADLVKLVEEHFKNELVVLAGNSIHSDKAFIAKWWPNLDLKLHYRMLDVSAWKILMQGKYGVVYEKEQVHRAFNDIQASIAELQHYIDYFKQTR